MYRLQKVIVLVDTSEYMKKNARAVRQALHLIDKTLKSYKNYEVRTTLHIIAYDDKAHYVSRNCIDSIRFSGRSNLANALNKLREIYSANSMYTYPPLVLLLSSGCTNKEYKEAINQLRLRNAFQFSSKLAFTYNTNCKNTAQTFKDFAGRDVFYGDDLKTMKKVLIEKLPKLVITKNKNKEFYYGREN